MSETQGPVNLAELTRETREIWDIKAAHWDERMGEGNDFHRLLVGPAAERLLAIQPGEIVLDIACGNGQFARRLAALGARVVATDFSQQFLDRARARTAEHAELSALIDYRMVDATEEAALLALDEGRFDAVTCLMALMDMTTIEPLARALPRLLKPGGRFVFVTAHPAFNSNAVRFLLEEEDRDGRLVVTRALKLTGYLDVPAGKGMGMPGEPAAHWYFHRPLSTLLAPFFAAGLALHGLEEPAFPPGTDPGRGLTWLAMHQFAPVLAGRMVRVTGDG